jgi:hypothetical protein
MRQTYCARGNDLRRGLRWRLLRGPKLGVRSQRSVTWENAVRATCLSARGVFPRVELREARQEHGTVEELTIDQIPECEEHHFGKSSLISGLLEQGAGVEARIWRRTFLHLGARTRRGWLLPF